MTTLAPEIDARFRDLALELGAVAARVGELTDVISGESLAIPRRLIFDATNTIREFSVDRGGREFHALKVDNPTNYPLYISFASNRGGNASDYDEIVEPGTGGIFTRPYEVVSIGFDAAARPAGAVAIPAVFYARPLPPTRWDLDTIAGDQVYGQYFSIPPVLAEQAISPLIVDSRGSLKVRVFGADGVANAPVSVPIDASGNTAVLFTVAQQSLFNGLGWDRGRTPNVFKVVNVAIVAGTPAAIWTPAAGKKFRLMGYALTPSAATYGRFIDGGGGELHRTEGAAANIGSWRTPGGYGNGQLSQAANNTLQLDVGAAATIIGVVFGTEE